MGLARIIGAGSGSIKKLVAEALTRLGVTTAASDKDSVVVANIDELATTKYNSGHDDGEDSVTISQSVSGRTVTAKASNGKTSSASVALGTDSGSHTFTLAPTGNNTATKDLSAGYYNAGTVTADGSKAYEAGSDSVTLSTSVSENVVTATASNGRTATGTVANKGSLTTTLTPTGNNTATKTFAAGYYDGGTITADGSAAYAAGKAAVAPITKTFTFTRTSEYVLTCSTGYTGYTGAKLNSFGSNVSFYNPKESSDNPSTTTLLYSTSYNSSTGVVTIGAGTINDKHYKFNGSSNCSITIY